MFGLEILLIGNDINVWSTVTVQHEYFKEYHFNNYILTIGNNLKWFMIELKESNKSYREDSPYGIRIENIKKGLKDMNLN